jgi:hypothetical protein
VTNFKLADGSPRVVTSSVRQFATLEVLDAIKEEEATVVEKGFSEEDQAKYAMMMGKRSWWTRDN